MLSRAPLKEETLIGLEQVYKMPKQILQEQILIKKTEDIAAVKAMTAAHQVSLQGLSSRTWEAETRISTLHDNVSSVRITIDQQWNLIQTLQDKINDLEGPSRRNNLGVVRFLRKSKRAGQ